MEQLQSLNWSVRPQLTGECGNDNPKSSHAWSERTDLHKLIQRDARLNLRGFDSQSETQKGVCVCSFRNAGYSFCAFARPLSSARARSAVQKLSSGFTPFALDKCLILETSKSEKDLSKKHSKPLIGRILSTYSSHSRSKVSV